MAPMHCTTMLVIRTSTFSSKCLLGSTLPTFLISNCNALTCLRELRSSAVCWCQPRTTSSRSPGESGTWKIMWKCQVKDLQISAVLSHFNLPAYCQEQGQNILGDTTDRFRPHLCIRRRTLQAWDPWPPWVLRLGHASTSLAGPGKRCKPNMLKMKSYK